MLVKDMFFKNKKGEENANKTVQPHVHLSKNKERNQTIDHVNRLEGVKENSCLSQIPKERLKALDEFQKQSYHPTAGRRKTVNPMLCKLSNTVNKNSWAEIKRRRRRSMFPAGGGAQVASDRTRQREALGKKKKSKRKVVYQLGDEKFVLYHYYTPTAVIGKGAYACVCSAISRRTGKKVAIKKNKGVFHQLEDAKRILRELKLMAFFDHDDVVGLVDVIVPNEEEIESFQDVYLVLQKMEMSLLMVIQSLPLTNRHFQFLVYQMLRGLKYIHSAGVIHRDLKPANLLVNCSDCNLKITDFGLARGICKDEGAMTEYVVTRWYRAPEVMCSGSHYDAKVDMWSVGCIFAEMILRRPLFPGGNHLEQLRIIFSIMGTPGPESRDWMNPEARHWVERMIPFPEKDLRIIFPQATADALDLLNGMLQVDPNKRISVEDALAHPYLSELHDPSKEITCEKFDISFEYERRINSSFGVRHMMYEELKNFRRNCRVRRAKIKKMQKARTGPVE